MAKWQRTLNLLPEWESAESGDPTPKVLAGVIATRLRELAPFGIGDVDDERDEIVAEFETLARDDATSRRDIDCMMNQLYDWADQKLSGDFFDAKKVCWVKTF